MKIGIIDCGGANLSSIGYSINRLGYEPVITNNLNKLKNVDKLIIPGVGSADRVMGAPTLTSPLSNDTIDGVVLLPSEFTTTTGSPPSMTDTHEFVVPKSIPIILDIFSLLIYKYENGWNNHPSSET